MVISAETGHILAKVVPGVSLAFVHTGELAYVAPDGTLMSAHFDTRSLTIGTPMTVVPTGSTTFAYFERALPVAISPSGTVVYVSSFFEDFADKELVLVAPGPPPKTLPTRQARFPRTSILARRKADRGRRRVRR